MNNPLVTINLVVKNGEKYIRQCLEAVKNQSYPNIEFNVFDNASTDTTKEILRSAQNDKKNYPEFNLIEWKENLGLGGGQEKALEFSKGKYILALCVDVLLDKNYVAEAINSMETMSDIGALQPKMYRFDITNGYFLRKNVIDSCGFKIFRSRRLINIGHGEDDRGEYDKEQEIFSFEGAAPFFRKQAMEDCRIEGEIYDRDLFWYATDIDLGWKMRLLGWKSWYNPKVVAWHDRPTSKDTKRSWLDYLLFKRQNARSQISKERRKLQFRNLHLVLAKYEFKQNVLKDFFPFLKREIMVLGYHTLFEPWVFAEVPAFFKKLPLILRKRKKIMSLTRLTPNDIRKWYY